MLKVGFKVERMDNIATIYGINCDVHNQYSLFKVIYETANGKFIDVVDYAPIVTKDGIIWYIPDNNDKHECHNPSLFEPSDYPFRRKDIDMGLEKFLAAIDHSRGYYIDCSRIKYDGQQFGEEGSLGWVQFFNRIDISSYDKDFCLHLDRIESVSDYNAIIEERDGKPNLISEFGRKDIDIEVEKFPVQFTDLLKINVDELKFINMSKDIIIYNDVDGLDITISIDMGRIILTVKFAKTKFRKIYPMSKYYWLDFIEILSSIQIYPDNDYYTDKLDSVKVIGKDFYTHLYLDPERYSDSDDGSIEFYM